MKVGALILARTDSRRLPGKALRRVVGRALIQYAIDCCHAVDGLDLTACATTDRPEDDELARYAADIAGIRVFRGPVDDVAGRFLEAMNHFGLDAALRFNGDSPLNRPALLSQAVSLFRAGGCDLVSNVVSRTFPYGISAEVVSRAAMAKACHAMTEASHREHVTKFFYDNPGFAVIREILAAEPGLAGVQLAVDDARDLDRLAWILAQLHGRSVHEAGITELVSLAREFDTGVRS